LFIPAGLLAVVAAATLAALVRGSWSDAERRVPAEPGGEPVCYVHQNSDVEKEVRCAVRLAAPMDEVWAVITDYEHFGDICSCVHAARIEHEPNGICRLEARANSLPPGQMPFEVEMRHKQLLHQYQSSWDQPSGELLVNRGQWVLTPLSPRETLLEVSLEIQVRHVPTFILRNLSFGRLRAVAMAVERRLRDGPSGKTW
jgi:uncharacterized membrane protein